MQEGGVVPLWTVGHLSSSRPDIHQGPLGPILSCLSGMSPSLPASREGFTCGPLHGVYLKICFPDA